MSDDLDIQRLARRLRDPLRGWGFVVSESDVWTPTYDGATPGTTTYSLQVGAWRRVGSIMIATCIIVWTAATGTGNARIALPVASVNVTNLDYGGSASLQNVTFANSTPTIEVVGGNAFFQLRSPLTNAAGALVQVEAAGTLVFTVTYFVA